MNPIQDGEATTIITAEPLLVTLGKLVDEIPVPPPPAKRPRGRPKVYSDRLFLKALVIMVVRDLRKVHELVAVLAEPTAEMQMLRALLTEQDRYPTRRTWERRLKAMPTMCQPRSVVWGATWCR